MHFWICWSTSWKLKYDEMIIEDTPVQSPLTLSVPTTAPISNLIISTLRTMANGVYTTALNNYFQKRQELDLISWKDSSEGLPHALVWTATCRVNGQVLGVGTANQLRVAKEQAAEAACQALGIPA
ncbi:hypothetical protein BDN67DRAFT_966452 [Paxillus ammoniavirescens]|nr:hypothetical protein BDN67DRAFT_966452 [Paxillus ammoniavirescens]